jgi:hypothetical protein
MTTVLMIRCIGFAVVRFETLGRASTSLTVPDRDGHQPKVLSWTGGAIRR